jgi:hypothetical protein
MKDRLERLAALTRGAAVVTIGMGAVVGGCTKNEPSAQPTIAAAGSTPAELTDPGPDASDADAGRRLRPRFPIPNAMHPGWRFRDAGPSDGGADGSSGP